MDPGLADELEIEPGPSLCPVSEIPGFFWSALDLDARVRAGVFAAAALDVVSWHYAYTVRSALESATREFAEQRREAQEDMKQRLTELGIPRA